jgi:hypothetical protein
VTASSGLASVRAERSLGFGSGLTIRTGPGHDDVTGAGTPSGVSFLGALGS